MTSNNNNEAITNEVTPLDLLTLDLMAIIVGYGFDRLDCRGLVNQFVKDLSMKCGRNKRQNF